jgi:gamma-glutamyltranspeptidase/glutathione hydrolase
MSHSFWGTIYKFSLMPTVIGVLSCFVVSCSSLTVETFHENGVIATSSPIASEIGLEVLRNGGNAIDAAIAVGFALAVCYPEAGNIGGGGFALIYNSRNSEVTALDFREKAPGGATVDMYLDESGNVIANSSTLGAKAAGVPGTVAGLYELWKRYGTMAWYVLVEPAIRLADTGFIVDNYLAESFESYRKQLEFYPETKAVFFNNGITPKNSERFIQKELALTLERIGRDSINGFYAEETADFIVQTMQKHDGLIDHDDLSNYQPVWREPIVFKFDSLDIYSMPPPSSGGVILGEILGLLEPYEFFKYTCDSPEYIHLFAEACRLAYADRAVYLGDPDFIDNPIAKLLDSTYLNLRRNLINIQPAGTSERIEAGPIGRSIESESTTHYSITDKSGNAVSLTYTINTSYGSKLVVDGAGFLLNNEMDDFSVKPDVANTWGLIGGKANEIAPGKRMLSSMSPTIVLHKGKPLLILGSPGGSKIITTVAEAILNVTRFGINLQQAIKQPRFHHQWLPDTLYLEQGGFDINVMQDLISWGHNIKERNKYSELQIIYINESGLMTGASDPRRNGKTVGY